MTPEERLASINWRLGNSIWMLSPLLGLGAFSFPGFVYVAVKARDRILVILAAVFTALGVGYIISTFLTETADWQGGFLVFTWLAGIVAAWFANRRWLRWRAVHPRGSDAWYKGGPSQTDAPLQPQASMGGSPFAASSRDSSDWPQPPHTLPRYLPEGQQRFASPQPSHVVQDVNAIDEPGLVALGLTEQQAAHFVAVRSRVSGFGSVQEALTSGALPPHSFMSVRDALGEPASQSPPEARGGGRVLDF